MPFYRFEQFESTLLTLHLSSGAAPVIEGQYMYFCLLHKEAGTGSDTACATPTRYDVVESTAWLENKIDTMSPDEQSRARVERKAN